MKIGRYSFEEYIENVKSFHGSIAPGMVIGGYMVTLAKENLPEGEFFDVICETGHCLPDSVQLLTPCTIGNGWLKILDLGRYAMTFYEKYGGEGVRIYLDPDKVKDWPEIKSWFFKLKPKREQDMQLLLKQIREAGKDIFSIQRVKVKPDLIKRKESKGDIAICSRCNEAYPARDGKICRACQGGSPYLQDEKML
jgi:formylmethanofuran dehydrogenase subunit E